MFQICDHCDGVVVVSAFSVSQQNVQRLEDHPQQQSSSSLSASPLQRVVVVGGGVGGLAVAARIAASNKACNVTILEKNDLVGGRCGSVDILLRGKGTFRHDRGPSLLLLPNVYQDLFRECGTSSDKYGLVIRPCQPAYQVVFDAGDRIDLGFPKQPSIDSDDAAAMRDLEAISRQKMDSFEPKGSRKLDDYMRAMSAFLDCGLPNFIEERFDLSTFPAFLREALRDFGKVRRP